MMIIITTSEGAKTMSDEEAKAVIEKLSKAYYFIKIDTLRED
jgi:hypothetical protein